jgi:putative ABC transport system substrate-binding protein
VTKTSGTSRALIITVLMCTALLAASADAAQPAVPRIGVLVHWLADSPYEAGLRDGLHDLGYIEGNNVVIEWRRTIGTNADLLTFASELARSKVDLMVVVGTPAARAALQATTTIPIVFISGDPVASGLAQSVAHPGGNATGVSILSAELTGKRLELLRLAAPAARRIAFLFNSTDPPGVQQLDAAQKGARTLGVQLVAFDVRNQRELDAALLALPRSGVDGVLVTTGHVLRLNKSKVARAIRKAKLPAMFPYREYHDDGVLMSYGPNTQEVGRKMAFYVDKILKGAKPADLPIEEMSTYQLVIDLRVARELGIKVPQELLQRADEVIR